MKRHKHGFTLAEVLITLVIIGIIAAMTIPTLMNKTNEQELIVATKKAFSILNQAHQRMVADYGTDINPSYFGATAEEITKNYSEEMIRYLSIQKVCGISSGGDCWATSNGGMYKLLNGQDWLNWNQNDSNNDYKFMLSDGVSVAITLSSSFMGSEFKEPFCYRFGEVNVDVNGDKGPNTLGKDVFKFHLTRQGLYPVGTPDEVFSDKYFATCRTTGRGCAAWVITKGNMDYLRKDVSW